MADTSYIKTYIEPHVREWLALRFPGHIFEKRPLVLTTGGTHRFDAVSEDGSVAAAILCNRPKTRTGRENTGAVRKAGNDVNYLRLLPESVRKLMVFTDPGFSELARRRTARLGGREVEMMVCELPGSLSRWLTAILDEASEEQRAADS